MDLQERLRVHLDAETSAIRTADIGEVMSRGERIRRRRRVVTTAIPTMAVAALVAVFVLMQDTESQAPDIDRVADANAALSIQPASFDWEARPATLGWNPRPLTSGDMMYVLSTAPGVRSENFPNGDLPQAVYASSDGIDWTVNPLNGSWASDLTASDGVLYVAGTAPAAQDEQPTLVIGRSTDDGASFDRTEFPLDMDHRSFVTTHTVAASDGVVALAAGRLATDPMSLLPPGALTGGDEAVVTDDGIAVFPTRTVDDAYEICFGGEPDACAELIETEASHFSSWEELGLDAEEMVHGQVFTGAAYWSSDGQRFEPIEYPLPRGFIDATYQVAGEAVVTVDGVPYASADARNWHAVGVDAAFGGVIAMGQLGEDVVAVAQPSDGGLSVMRAPDLDGPWEEIPLGEQLGVNQNDNTFAWVSAASVSDQGVALNVSLEQARGGGSANPLTELTRRIFGGNQAMDEGGGSTNAGTVLFSEDLTNWSAAETSGISAFIDSLYLTPHGSLVAHGQATVEGRPQRMQFIAQP